MADFTPIARTKNALDNRKLNLSTKCPSAEGKYSSLIWGIHSNNPRITVYTNDPNDQKDNGRISANLDMPVFFSFLAKFNEVIEHDGEIKYKIENKNYIFPGGKRSESPVVVSELWFGKEKDGMIWISVIARDRPKIKFPFTVSEFHKFQHADGSEFTTAELSKMVAKGYLNILTNMMTALAVDNYVEPPAKPAGGNKGGYGGGNKGGYNGGSSSKQADDQDDDMPW